MPLSPHRLGTSLCIRRKRTTNEERILVLDLYMLLTISAAGFFATHNNLFFYISFLYVCLTPLKNDGRSELRFSKVVNTCLSFLNEVKNPSRKYRYYMLFLNEPNRKIKEWLWQKSRPRFVGEGGGGAVGRGKCEQKRKKVSYKTVLYACLSFLSGREKLIWPWWNK